MKIPVFHDDQRGTSIIVGAALTNALVVVGKKIEDIRIATTGMGAAGIACVVVALGVKPERAGSISGRRAAQRAQRPGPRQAARIRVTGSELAGEVPEARAYLVFGDAQAHALGRRLSAESMRRAEIVLADELSIVLVGGAAKRRLWSALRNLRRALAATES
ncbi:MAG: hypothetical protein WDW38_002199 [Sanguina aurantia]